jgi:hypothetical protein
MMEALLPEMLLMESKDGSADAYADIRVEERSRDETQEDSGANEETQNADANAVDDVLSVGTMFEERSDRERGERSEDLQAR